MGREEFHTAENESCRATLSPIIVYKSGSVNILMELFKKHSIDARYHLCLIIVVELIVATFLGCLEVCLRTLARSL